MDLSENDKTKNGTHTNNQGKVTATSAAVASETPFVIRWRKEECDLRKMCCTYKYAHYLIKGQNVEQIVLQHLARHFWYPRTLWKWLDWHHQKASTDVLQRKWLLSIESSENSEKKTQENCIVWTGQFAERTNKREKRGETTVTATAKDEMNDNNNNNMKKM